MNINIGKEFFGGSHPLGSGDLTGVNALVSVFLKGAFVTAGLIILFFFISAGISMISNAGAGDEQKSEQARKTMTSAVIGFAIVFASYWIVKLIGQIIGMPDLI